MMETPQHVTWMCFVIFCGHLLFYTGYTSGCREPEQEVASQTFNDNVMDSETSGDYSIQSAIEDEQNYTLPPNTIKHIPSATTTTDSLSRSELLLWMVDELASIPPTERLSVMKHLENVLDAEIYDNTAYTNPIYLNDIFTRNAKSKTSSLKSDRQQPCTGGEHCHSYAEYSKEYMKEIRPNVTSKRGAKNKRSRRRSRRRHRKRREMDMSVMDEFCDSPDCASSGDDYVDIDVKVYKEQSASRLFPEELECPDAKDIIGDLFYSSNQVSLGCPMRALRTLPEGWLTVAESRIPGAGLGVFATTFISANTWLGEYQGEIVPDADDTGHRDHTYTWMVTKVHVISYNIDAYDERISNWLRYVNTPRHISEENVHVRSCYGRIMYMTSHDIAPGSELLVYYGDAYMENLGIDMKNYFKKKDK